MPQNFRARRQDQVLPQVPYDCDDHMLKHVRVRPQNQVAPNVSNRSDDYDDILPTPTNVTSTSSRRSYGYIGYGSVSSWHTAHEYPSPILPYHNRPRSARRQLYHIGPAARGPMQRELESRNRHRPQHPQTETIVHLPTIAGESKLNPTFSPYKMRALSRLVRKPLSTLDQKTRLLHEKTEETITAWKEVLRDPLSLKNVPDSMFKSKQRLGCGAFGEVDEISIEGQSSTLARKQMKISRRKTTAAKDIKLIEDEISNLKSLTHIHIVRMLGYYQANEGTYKHSYCLLMHPVGERDLGAFLEDECRCIATEPDCSDSITKSAWIMKWFTCLPSALAYMHSQLIHHEDIKPKNIIHKGEHVYFTDFSSSRRCDSTQATSTANPARASRLFAAPEAFPTSDDNLERHGSKTDVFSLGLVFVEMLTILEGRDIDGLHDYLEQQNGFGEANETKQYHRAVELMNNWFSSNQSRYFFTKCLRPMLRQERSSRPSAEEVVELVRVHQPWGRTLACPCKDSASNSLLGT